MVKRGLNLPKQRTFTGPAMIWRRILAFVADIALINLVVLFPFKKVVRGAIPEFSSYTEAYNFLVNNPSYTKDLTILYLAISFIVLLYFVILEYKIQQTPGKMILRISIVSETKKMSFWQALLRSLFIIPLFPFVLLWVIDPLFMIFTKTNQRLSEILSKTKTTETYIIG